MLQKIRTSKISKVIALLLAQFLLVEVIMPINLFALTGGPSQPEVQSFEPVGTSNMVNLFTGDFTYNIPLIDVGGYPINLSYHSGISMDQEASWTGLGWNINPGVINRNMRALPDDFKGDTVTKEFNMANNETYGVNLGVGGEIFGVDWLKLDFGIGVSYNNYTGYGFETTVEPSLTAGAKSSTPLTASLGLSASSEGGVGINPSVSFSAKMKSIYASEKNGISAKVGLGYNSRSGLSALSIGVSGNYEEFGMSHSTAYSFSYPTYTPDIDFPMINGNVSLSFTIGGELFGTNLYGRVSGYYATQRLAKKSISSLAYGYMYMEEGDKNDKSTLDYNREKDGSFTPHKPNLPVPNLTYDLYSVSGQGIGGMYRPYRSDYGTIYDRKMKSGPGGDFAAGVELGLGCLTHVGVNTVVNISKSSSGKWTDGNEIKNLASFRSVDEVDDPYFEPYYFKQVGELTSESCPEVLDGIGNFNPVMVDLEKENGGDNVKAINKLVNHKGESINFPSKNYRTKRQRRNETISVFTADQAQDYALIKEIESYPLIEPTNSTYPYTEQENEVKGIPRNEDFRKGHHISEVTTFRPDGAQYVYGIPAYNLTQQEVSFAITGGDPDCSTGLVSYTHGANNTTSNTGGLDNFFDRVTLPGYAHSYLLTAVLSADYIDITSNGPSDDDLGTYTKINYSMVDDNYKWRVPYQKDIANYNEGLKSKINSDSYGDDKANYIYGEKELWYMHSIETKTHVAEFILSDRCDAFEVDSDAGGIGESPMKKLVRIDLFSKQDKIKNGADAIPIKTVHFEYDYSLCPEIPNNNNNPTDVDGFTNQGGKLTLKKVYFTYQDSKRGKLNPYVFDYSELRDKAGQPLGDEDGINPSYNLKGYDRWGNYMPNTENTDCSVDVSLTNAEFPYTWQDRVRETGLYSNVYEEDNSRWLADVNAVAWNLTSIKLPSGGIINVDYEADDYAYVQHKKAMQMFKVVGTAVDNPSIENVKTSIDNAQLYNNDKASCSYLIVELPNKYSDNVLERTPENFVRDFVTGENGKKIKDLYFRFLLKIGPDNKDWEYVSGYAELDFDDPDNNNFGFIDESHAYLKLKAITMNDEVPSDPKVNPISQAGWNFIKMYLPEIAYDKPAPGSKDAMEVFNAMASAFGGILDAFNGLCDNLRANNYSKDFKAGKSWVRLYNAEQVKKGGGNRVKRVYLSDQWAEMTNLPSYKTVNYGQEYDYTLDIEDKIISSGVASYEPMVGGEENPFRQPVSYSEKNLLVASNDYYMERPFGESYFPGASVGYSKVTVRNLQHDKVTKNATGRVEHEFYTAKDFPTITYNTQLKKIRVKNNGVFKILSIEAHDYMTASQGYVVELNDMHGKQKSQKVFPENSDASVSEVEYKYKSNGNRLVNSVDVIEKDGSISQQNIGIDYDFVVDVREQESETTTAGLNVNTDGFLLGIFPIVVPVILPKYAHEETRFRSIVTTKVINRYGLLESVTAKDNGSEITTTNKLYDAESGQVLLTETQNQYSDSVFSFNYPAHWAYDLMGPAYKNLGVNYTASNISDLVEGDKVAYDGKTAWVTNVEGELKLLNAEGQYCKPPSSMKVISSGRKNQQMLSIGSVVSLSNPLITAVGGTALSFSNVLEASAIEYSDHAGVFCGTDGLEIGMNYNPYVHGARGVWKQQKTYAYLTNRTQTRTNNNTFIREDGVYEDFSPFWIANNQLDWNKNISNPKWVSGSEVTIFSPFGAALENRDALGRYSSAVYGYNQSLPVATAANAMYQEIAFDGFEDYDVDDCNKDHFSYEEAADLNIDDVKITSDESHTGKRSIQLGSGVTIGVRKVVIPCDETE